MITACGLALALAPWAIYVVSQGAASNTQPLLQEPTSVNLFNSFSQFLFGFQEDSINTLLVSLWPVVVLLGFLVLRKRTRAGSETLYVLLATFLPIVAAFMVSILVRPIFVTRYLIVAVPTLYLFVAWLFSTYPPRLARALRIGFVALVLVTLAVQGASAATPAKENYREASEYLESQTRAGDTVVVSSPFTVYPVEYYYRGPARIQTIPVWDRFTSGAIPAFSAERLPEEVEAVAGRHQRLWLLLSYDQGYEEQLRIYFDTNYERIDEQQFSPGLSLYGYKLRYDQVPLQELLER